MKEYLDLVRLVLDKGIRKPSRTGVDTISYFGAFYKVDLAAGFPLLTTKKVNFKSCLHELLWYLSGDDHIRNLRKVTKIWDAWADEKGDLETAYGRYWRRFPHPMQRSHAPIAETGEATAPIQEIDQIQYVIDEIKRNPFSRRLVVVAWEPGNAEVSKLPPCHYSFAFNVSPDETGNPQRLNCHLTQRSGDIALGIPFNLACYATLTQMIAQEVGLEVGQFGHTIIDAHIYCADAGSAMAEYDHVAGLKEQLKREPRALPKLVIANKPFKELTFEDFRVENYDPHPAIQFKVAV
ncbi:MAG TPA: thymidylate synthase [Phycisphaerae bacterium]|nr:thymidylate synthase [Phycisphaerae bacterium]